MSYGYLRRLNYFDIISWDARLMIIVLILFRWDIILNYLIFYYFIQNYVDQKTIWSYGFIIHIYLSISFHSLCPSIHYVIL